MGCEVTKNVEKRVLEGKEGIYYRFEYTGDNMPKAYLNYTQLKITDKEDYVRKKLLKYDNE